MSIRLQMLQVARLAPMALGDAADLVAEFVRGQRRPDGGFADRDGRSDLYYTVFGLDSLLALRQPLPAEPVAAYLDSFGEGGDLDFIHLTCLARCHAALRDGGLDDRGRRGILDRLADHRTPEGGYHVTPGAGHGSAYGCFLAVACCQDIGEEPPDAAGIGRCLDALAVGGGAHANDTDMKIGNVPATAAAVTLRHQLGLPIDPASGDFLLSCCHEDGGFLALPEAPMPDLLSTAVALHALSAMHRPIDPVRERCLDFIDTLWTNRGGFYGNWAEQEGALDVEYTYYGLLALGHLSL